MNKRRIFTGDNIPKIDRLIMYLTKNKIMFTFHADWRLVQNKREPFYIVQWFEPVYV